MSTFIYYQYLEKSQRKAFKEMATCIENSEGKKNINIVLFGKTGIGKSAVGNTILGRQAFAVSNKKESKTEQCQLECNEVDDVLINVVDTPSLMDTKISDDEILQRIFCAMSFCPDGFNALVYVMSYDGRFTKEEEETLYLLKQGFGESFTKDFCIVIMTKGDCFETNKDEGEESYSFDDWLKEQTGPEEFMALLKECKNRVVLFYNKGWHYKLKKEESLKMFFEYVRSRPDKYTSQHFDECKKHRDAVILEKKLHNQKLYVQKNLILIRQDIDKVIKAINGLLNEKDDLIKQQQIYQIEQKINEMRKRAENLLAEIEKEDNGTGDMEKLIKDVKKIISDIDIIKEKPAREQMVLLSVLDAFIITLKLLDSWSLYLGFALTALAIADVGLSVVAMVAAPIIIIGAAAAAMGYYFYTHYSKEKKDKKK